jgi:lauroyl/myristoyl acyltransferase
MNFEPTLKNYPSDDQIKNANKTNKILQDQVLKAPEQYLWIHKRFKTQPEGEEYFYKDL